MAEAVDKAGSRRGWMWRRGGNDGALPEEKSLRAIAHVVECSANDANSVVDANIENVKRTTRERGSW